MRPRMSYQRSESLPGYTWPDDVRLRAIDGYTADYQRAAESEARRILAETEPQGKAIGQWRDAWYDGLEFHPCEAIERRFLRSTVVESISAFLAAPDPAAYLASKQERS